MRFYCEQRLEELLPKGIEVTSSNEIGEISLTTIPDLVFSGLKTFL